MSIPDFSVKSDPSIIQAFQNANQQRMQAEAMQNEEKQRKFNRTLETTQAIGNIVSSMVDVAEKKKQNQLMNQAESILSKPKPAETIQPSGALEPISNPVYEDRQKSLMHIARSLPNSNQLGKEAAKEVFGSPGDPTASQFSVERISIPGKGQMIINVDKLNKRAYDLAGNDITAQVAKAVPAFAPMAVETGSGVVNFIERNIPGQSSISTTDTPIKPEKEGKTTELTGLNRKDRDKAFKMIEEAKSDPVLTKSRELVRVTEGIRQAINSNDKVAMDRMGGLMQKVVAMDSGNLAAWEQRDPNSRAAIDRISNWLSFAAKGQPTKDTKEMILETLNNMETVNKDVMDTNFEFHATSVIENFPQLSKEAVKRKMGKEALKKKAMTPEEEADNFFKGL